MNRLLFLLTLALFALVSCSKEEEAPAPPPTPTYKLSFSADEGGTVSTEGGTYNQGSKITVTATPDGQYLFKEWSDGSTVNPREITVNADLTLKATFVKKTYPLSVTIDGEGTVQEQVIIQGSTTETQYNAGTTVRLTATANEGWEFSLWVVDGEVIAENPIEVAIEKGREATVFFKRTQFELNITIEGEGTVKEDVIVQPSQYDYETVVRLTAVPADGWEFSGWNGDVNSEDNPIELDISESISMNAIFIHKGYSISRNSIFIPINTFPSVNSIAATIRDISGMFVYQVNNKSFLIRPGVTGNEDSSGIENTDPSPTIILEKIEGKWNLKKVDQNIYTWVIRNYSFDNGLITLGDGNEIGPNETNNRWKGDVWQGKVDSDGDIDWNRITTNETRSYHHGLATGDLNGDGFLDIGTGPDFFDENGIRLGQSIWINNGDDSYTFKFDLVPNDSPSPFGLGFGDVLGDNRDEIINGDNAVGYNNPTHIYIYKIDDSTGKYILHNKVSDENKLFNQGMMTTKVSIYDFNNDGNNDIITYNADESGAGFAIWIGSGNGQFTPHFSKFFQSPTLSSSEYEIFDANNDGYLDVLLRPSGYNPIFRVNPTEYNRSINNGIKLNELIWINNGNATFNSFDDTSLVINGPIEGKVFHPYTAIPYMENNQLHYLAVEETNILNGDYFEYTVYDIKLFLE